MNIELVLKQLKKKHRIGFKIKKIIGCSKVIEAFIHQPADHKFACVIERDAMPFAIIWRKKHDNQAR